MHLVRDMSSIFSSMFIKEGGKKMVKKHLSRFLAVIVAFALSLSCLPLEAVYAAGVSESKYPTLQEAVKNQMKSFENYNADDEVEFIVELEEETPAGKKVAERLFAVVFKYGKGRSCGQLDRKRAVFC